VRAQQTGIQQVPDVRVLQTVDGKHVCELPLSEVCDVQGTKEDAILEFHIDDAALRGREDALTSATFVLPEENEDFAGEAPNVLHVPSRSFGPYATSSPVLSDSLVHTMLHMIAPVE
jgi:hypothetical protein